MNLYGFAGGDPVNFNDPLGLCPPKDRNVQTCASVQFWRDAASASGSSPGAIGATIMAGLAAVGESAIAEVQGHEVGECGVSVACGVVPAVGGAKSPSEYARHAQKLESAMTRLGDLEARLARAKGPKAQAPIREMISQLSDDIKGHVKEMRQKWPEGKP